MDFWVVRILKVMRMMIVTVCVSVGEGGRRGRDLQVYGRNVVIVFTFEIIIYPLGLERQV